MHFLGKNRLSEWKLCFFFFRCCFFFSGPKNRVSEWTLNFSWEKKKTEKVEKMLGKKKQPKCEKIAKHKGFWPFFCKLSSPQTSEWLQTFPGKKKKTVCIFFFPESGKKKKQNSRKSSEWVAVNYSGEKKNTVPLPSPNF